MIALTLKKYIVETVVAALVLAALLAVLAHVSGCHEAKVALAEKSFETDLADCRKKSTKDLREKCTDDVLLAWHISQTARDAGGDQ